MDHQQNQSSRASKMAQAFICLLILCQVTQCPTFVVLNAVSASANEGFDTDTSYIYSYSTLTRVNTKSASTFNSTNWDQWTGSGAALSSLVKAKVQVNLVWRSHSIPEDKLLRIQVSEVQVTDPDTLKAVVDSKTTMTALLHRTYGKIQAFYSTSDLSTAEVNFLRGVASLLQFQKGEAEGTESDVSGSCQVHYSLDHHGIHKTKSGCNTSSKGRTEKILGVNSIRHYEAKYQMQGGVVGSVEVKEALVDEVSLYKSVGYVTKIEQSFTLREQVDSNLEAVSVESVSEAVMAWRDRDQLKFESQGIEASYHVTPPTPVNIKNQLANMKKHLSSSAVATVDGAKAFAKLHDALATATKDQIVVVVKDRKYKDLLPQIMDVLGSIGTLTTHEAALEVAKSKPNLLERYLWALAQCPTVDIKISEGLLELSKSKEIKSEKAQETLTQTIATLARVNPEFSKSVQKWLESEIASCKSEPCLLKYLRAFRNCHPPEAVPFLIKILSESKSKKMALAALKALAKFPRHSLTKAHPVMLTLFSDPTADSSIRTISGEILLQGSPSTPVFRQMLQVMANDSKEFTSYCVSRMYEISSRDSYLDRLLRSHVSSGHINWDLLSRTGLSTSFSRYLAQTESGSAFFNFAMELAGVVFKRSSSESMLQNDDGQAQLLQLDIFAGGLSSYVGGAATAADDDDADANAGMELRILGNSLRPFIFFESSSDLMSLYWSGKASEKTSALQGSFFLQNHDEVLRLCNGVILVSTAKGSLSFDFSGKADVSLWEKTTTSLVENTAAYHLTSSLEVSSLDVIPDGAKLSQTLVGRAQLNLEMELDFSDSTNVKMCIRMHTPPFSARHNSAKTYPRSKKLRRTRDLRVSGRTLYLNHKNSDMCNRMYPKI